MELVTNAPSGAADQTVIGASRNQAPPKSLPATATFILSEAGRKASLLAGGDGKALQTLTLNVPAGRLHLVSVDRQGVARLHLRPRFELDGEQRVVRLDSSPAFDAPPHPEDLLRLAARNHELEQAFHAARTAATLTRNEAQRELRERVAQAFLADQGQRAVAHPPPTQRYCVIEAEGRRIVFDVSVDPVLAKPVAIEATRRFRTDRRARREQNLQERAMQLALHEEKNRFVADWIAKHGTPDQQARQAAGVLPMAEAVEAIADQAFAPASDHPRYVRDGASSLQELLRASPEHANIVVAPSDVVAETTVQKTATAAEWATVEKLRRTFPDGTVTLMAQRLRYRPAPAAVECREAFAAVALRVGLIAVRREYSMQRE
jgi:hypothetical protein